MILDYRGVGWRRIQPSRMFGPLPACPALFAFLPYAGLSINFPSPKEKQFMVNYLELPVGERAPEVFRSVIEIPKDGIQKFEYDKQLHVFKLDRNLHSPVHYPGDYGFIPSTLSDDGDP